MLSDVEIIEAVGTGAIEIDPYDESNVEPASVDLRLGDDFTHVEQTSPAATVALDSGDDDALTYVDAGDEPVILEPGAFVLATTHEHVALDDEHTAQVLGRSSLGRLGVSVHQTAGFIDPGFEGHITLELSNHGPAPVELRSGLRVCQIVFSRLESPAVNPYGHDGSHYQQQTGATSSAMQFE